LFSFPSDPEKRAIWVSKVPRQNWKPSASAKLFLCEKHFHHEDIVTSSKDSNPRRKRKRKSDNLMEKRLRDGAMPCIWPNVAAHKIPTPRPTKCTTSSARKELSDKREEEIVKKKISLDSFTTIENLVAKSGKMILPDKVLKYVSVDTVLFYKLDFIGEVPSIKYSVKVSRDLTISVYYYKEKLKSSFIDTLISNDGKKNMCSTLSKIILYLD